MTTEIGLLILLALVIALEGWALLNKKPGDTITEVTQRLIKLYPIIAFLAGLVCGHLFWPPADCLKALQ
jgi:hypothetical protein